MKAFAKTTKEIVQKEETDTRAQIKAKVETIFDDQRSVLQLRVDTIGITVTIKLNQHKDIAKDTVDEIRRVKIDYLNLLDKKKSMNRHIEKTYDEFKNKKEQFETDTTLIATETMDKIDMAVITIKEEIKTMVEHHLTLEYMNNIISSNALESFTTICNSKSTKIVDRIGTTTKAIPKDNILLKTHVENISAKITAFDKQNIQETVSKTVHSSTTQCIIDGYSKTVCLQHAAAATNEFAEVISEEDKTEKEKRKQNY